MAHRRNWLIPLALSGVAACLWGCRDEAKITRYTVVKPPPIESVATALPDGHPPVGPGETAEAPTGEPRDRMLGAMVPFLDRVWFFKLMGPKAAVTAQESAFQGFIKSLHFSADGKPGWTLPKDWKEQPGSEMRYATLMVPGEGKPMELTVIFLGKPEGDFRLTNLNRWRGQLKLPPIDEEKLASETTTLELPGTTATLVDLLGTAAPGGMGRGPFMSGARDGN